MKPQWTKTPPTQDGYYWYRYDMSDEPEVVEIDMIHDQPTTKHCGWDVWTAEWMGNQEGYYWPVRIER